MCQLASDCFLGHQLWLKFGHSYSFWFALFFALFMPSCSHFRMVHVILSLPSFGPHFAICEMRAEGGQWQYHMNHAKTASGGHKEGKKRGQNKGQNKGQKEGAKRGQILRIVKLSEKLKLNPTTKLSEIWKWIKISEKLNFHFRSKSSYWQETYAFNWNIQSQPYRKNESEFLI